MDNSLDIQLELSKTSLLFDQYICILQKKLALNKSKITITKNDLDYLKQIQEKINNIAKNVRIIHNDSVRNIVISEAKEFLENELQRS